MGYSQRGKQRKGRERREDELRRLLGQFPDRSTYERWVAQSRIDDAHRAHLEAYLPAQLRAQGAV